MEKGTYRSRRNANKPQLTVPKGTEEALSSSSHTTLYFPFHDRWCDYPFDVGICHREQIDHRVLRFGLGLYWCPTLPGIENFIHNAPRHILIS